ncbi:MAG: LysW-gamma-L-lysine/LysW-L-ornithine aminotransferase [Thermomicrobiales bacterium]|nr:LysW-gamma-L-lysine/LysW-L-ornithine aminotransferase [Thermomicrobiales bacterium]MEA2523407.1 LysW-gamma-L-lysine/LysW-L-ornithine aminotransferase [Thermomicrobiales bacterium]MEA2530342.1 LysW-gamma-L-lysine/LysW-L-ornithine aminotransferase [Thermomicrobiales bacterium]
MTSLAPTLELDAIQSLEHEHQLPLYAKREIALVRGEGPYLFDSEGKRYLDAMSNYGVAVLGHADPEFAAALTDQLGRLTTCHQSFYNDVRAALLAAIAEIAPDGLTRSFLSNSGAEAIEAGLKFARAATGRPKIVAARRAYHGRTLGALSATADAKYRTPFEPLPINVLHVPFNDADALSAAVDGETAAVILEPIQGEAGIFPADDAYLQAVRQITSAQGALLIADEVQTGFRTGVPFAIASAGVTPDILCTAKALANGFPIGLTLTTDSVSEKTGGGVHGTTFGGNPLACRAALATLTALKERGLYARSAELGARLMTGIEELESPKIRQVRGRGFMIGIELKERVTPTLRALQERGVLALPASPVVFRLLPPLVWEEEQVEEFLRALGQVLA